MDKAVHARYAQLGAEMRLELLCREIADILTNFEPLRATARRALIDVLRDPHRKNAANGAGLDNAKLLGELDAARETRTGKPAKKTRGPSTPEGKAKMSQLMKERWARGEFSKQKGAHRTHTISEEGRERMRQAAHATQEKMAAKRRMSPEGRASIAAAAGRRAERQREEKAARLKAEQEQDARRVDLSPRLRPRSIPPEAVNDQPVSVAS